MDFDALYSYMKYTNVGSWRSALVISMRKVKKHADPKNTISFAFAITREGFIRGILNGSKLQ